MAELIKKGHLLDEVHPDRARLYQPRQHIGVLPAQDRVGHWQEVEQGLTQDQAWQEAKRCMRCYRLFGVSTLKRIPGNSALEEL